MVVDMEEMGSVLSKFCSGDNIDVSRLSGAAMILLLTIDNNDDNAVKEDMKVIIGRILSV